MFVLVALCYIVWGISAETANNRLGIINGHPAPEGAYPWMVSFINNEYEATCGGILIDNRHILTAAHCEPHIFRARIGIHYTNDSTSVSILGMRNHPNYKVADKGNLYNDIALVRLASPVDNDYPTMAYDKATKKDCNTKRRTKLMGWGTIENGKETLPDVLMEANNVTIIVDRNKKCRVDGQIECPLKTQICAQDPRMNQDSDRGDSGGPMLIEKRGKLVLVGIVSYGTSSKFPACYTCVPFYQKWIKQQIGAKNW